MSRRHLIDILAKRKSLCKYIKSFLSIIFKREVWVFGSFNQQDFLHNAKALFLFVNQNYKKQINPIWITTNPILLRELNNEGLRCLLPNSTLGKLYSLFAKYHIVDWGISNINHAYSFNSTQVNLWHGIPLKKIERDIESVKKRAEKKDYLKVFATSFGDPSFMFACSEYDKLKFCSAFGVSLNKIYITGMARNDWLLGRILPTEQDQTLIHEILELKKKNRQLILYLPTFRDGKIYDIFSFIDEDFKQFMKENGVIMFCKMHLADSFSGQRTSCETVKWFDKNTDLYTILNLFDCLITDYSSIYFDFALTGKKIIHFCPDMEEYRDSTRGFYLDLKENLGGSFCQNRDGLKEAILGNTNYSDHIVEKFHKYTDGKSCKRIVEILL